MTFREALDRHLHAIQQRDLAALAETVAEDDLVLITAEGRLVQDAKEFLEMHRGWFAMDNWRLNVTPVEVYEAGPLGVAVLHLDYRETPKDKSPVYQESYLTLVFQEREGQWRMVQDQNTPIRQ
jgi:uncharacterized protein (TIGR02246 family)